jgi:hypothetical protein
MVKNRTYGFAVGIVSLIFICVPNIAWPGIVGSAHDFSAQSWSGDRICVACHTPHNADTSEIDAPLWNYVRNGSGHAGLRTAVR